MIQSSNSSQQTKSPLQNKFILSNKCPHIIYTPQAIFDDTNWYHPLLGYPMCPLIGRYNKGQYKIAQTILHLQFICTYHKQHQKQPNNKYKQYYKCGQHKLQIPQYLIYSLRNIPQIIAYNKPKNLKNEPQVHLTHHIAQNKIKLNFIISFGQIGKDFINYLNHCYIFDQSVFYGDKLNRTHCNIPIIVYLPQGSNICEEQVQRGISMKQWRSQYMSIHLKGGAPAFSPNNMRLGIKGMKKVVTHNNNNNNNNKKKCEGNQNKNNKKKQYKPKQQQNKHTLQQKMSEQIESKQISQKQQKQLSLQQYWDKLQKQVQVQKQQQQKQIHKSKQYNKQHKTNTHNNTLTITNKNSNNKQQITYTHFYTQILLQNDHRINYHWYIQNPYIQDIIKQIISNVKSFNQFIQMYRNIIGNDSMINQLSRLFKI